MLNTASTLVNNNHLGTVFNKLRQLYTNLLKGSLIMFYIYTDPSAYNTSVLVIS